MSPAFPPIDAALLDKLCDPKRSNATVLMLATELREARRVLKRMQYDGKPEEWECPHGAYFSESCPVCDEPENERDR